MSFKHAGIIFLCVGFIFLTISIVCAYNANNFLNNSIITTGKAVDVERTKSRDPDGNITIHNHLIVQFNDSRGNIIEFTDPVSSDDAITYNKKAYVDTLLMNQSKQNWMIGAIFGLQRL